MRICKIIDCEEKHLGLGFCKNHYQNWKYNNDPEYRENKLKAMKKWMNNNREKFNEGQRIYQKNNPELMLHYRTKKFIKNPELYRELVPLRGKIPELKGRINATNSRILRSHVYFYKWTEENKIPNFGKRKLNKFIKIIGGLNNVCTIRERLDR